MASWIIHTTGGFDPLTPTEDDMNLISYLEPQWDDEDVKQIASTLTPEQTATVYAEARQLLDIDESPAPEPTNQ